MTIKEIKNFPRLSVPSGSTWRGEEEPLHLVKEWEISVNGKVLVLKRWAKTHCTWDKLVLERDEKEVYRIVLAHEEDIRKEFFDNTLFRKYEGNQFSFVEYITLIGLINKFPNKLELTKYLKRIAKENNTLKIDRLSLKPLEQNLIDSYKEKAEKILSN